MTPSPRGGTTSRLAAVAAVTVVALAGVLALPALRGVAPPVAEPTDAPAVSRSEQIGAWLVEAGVTLLPQLGYRLDIRLTRAAAAPSPNRLRPIVVMGMDGMPDIEPPLLLVGDGGWRAEGRLPMPGRWRFAVGFDEGLLELAVDVPPPAGGAT